MLLRATTCRPTMSVVILATDNVGWQCWHAWHTSRHRATNNVKMTTCIVSRQLTLLPDNDGSCFAGLNDRTFGVGVKFHELTEVNITLRIKLLIIVEKIWCLVFVLTKAFLPEGWASRGIQDDWRFCSQLWGSDCVCGSWDRLVLWWLFCRTLNMTTAVL